MPEWMYDIPYLGRWLLRKQAQRHPNYMKTFFLSQRPALHALYVQLQQVLVQFQPDNGPFETVTEVERHQTKEGHILVLAVYLKGKATLRYGKLHFPLDFRGEVWQPDFEKVWNNKTGVYDNIYTPRKYASLEEAKAALKAKVEYFAAMKAVADDDATVPELF